MRLSTQPEDIKFIFCQVVASLASELEAVVLLLRSSLCCCLSKLNYGSNLRHSWSIKKLLSNSIPAFNLSNSKMVITRRDCSVWAIVVDCLAQGVGRHMHDRRRIRKSNGFVGI